MKWIALIVEPHHIKCEIEYEEYFYQGEKITNYRLDVFQDGKPTHDYLQDTLEIAMNQALEQFGVPLNAWTQVE